MTIPAPPVLGDAHPGHQPGHCHVLASWRSQDRAGHRRLRSAAALVHPRGGCMSTTDKESSCQLARPLRAGGGETETHPWAAGTAKSPGSNSLPRPLRFLNNPVPQTQAGSEGEWGRLLTQGPGGWLSGNILGPLSPARLPPAEAHRRGSTTRIPEKGRRVRGTVQPPLPRVRGEARRGAP